MDNMIYFEYYWFQVSASGFGASRCTLRPHPQDSGFKVKNILAEHYVLVVGRVKSAFFCIRCLLHYIKY